LLSLQMHDPLKQPRQPRRLFKSKNGQLKSNIRLLSERIILGIC
jgi:hypothetical protein